MDSTATMDAATTPLPKLWGGGPLNCVIMFVGFATLVAACVMSGFCWSNWKDLKKEKSPIDWSGGPGNHAWFMWYIVTLCIAALVFLGKPIVYTFRALGTAGGLQYMFGLIIGVLIFAWSRAIIKWEYLRTEKEHYYQSWELAWVGCVGPAVLAAGIIALLVITRGSICMK